MKQYLRRSCSEAQTLSGGTHVTQGIGGEQPTHRASLLDLVRPRALMLRPRYAASITNTPCAASRAEFGAACLVVWGRVGCIDYGDTGKCCQVEQPRVITGGCEHIRRYLDSSSMGVWAVCMPQQRWVMTYLAFRQTYIDTAGSIIDSQPTAQGT